MPLDYCKATQVRDDSIERFYSRYGPFLDGRNGTPTSLPGLRCGILGLAFAFAEIDSFAASARRGNELEFATYLLDYAAANRATLDFPDVTDPVLYTSFSHSDAGYWWLKSVVASRAGNTIDSDLCARRFMKYSPRDTACLDIVLGRAGWLLATLSLLERIKDESCREELQNHATAIADDLRGVMADTRDETRFAIQDPNFAHGRSGICYALLRYGSILDPNALAEVSPHVFNLAREARSHKCGVLPPHESDNSILKTSWCHGASGQVHMWLAAHKAFGDSLFLDLADAAGYYVGQGINTASPSLCCGMAGQAYALYSMYEHTKQAGWLQRARDLTVLVALQGEWLEMNDPYSHALYNGWPAIALLCTAWKANVIPKMPLM